jgi:hypothetical protein
MPIIADYDADIFAAIFALAMLSIIDAMIFSLFQLYYFARAILPFSLIRRR